jgi:hypothetical protein
MPSQGVFAQTAPQSGEIRVFYKTINGEDHIKALTVSNLDIDLDNVANSLNELNTISIPITGSGEVQQLEVISINEKNGYYFLDVIDRTIGSVSGSQGASIGLSPYLTETFFYNNYNAIISNAEDARESSIRYDVDRTGGQVRPSNFNAIAGFGTIIKSLKYDDGTGGVTDSVGDSDFDTSSQSLLGPITSSVSSFINNRDLTIRVLRPDLEASLGFPQTSVINVTSSLYNNPSYQLEVTSSLILQVDDNANFDNSNSHRTTHTLATQDYTNGEINSTYHPFQLAITSGSFTSGNVFVRLKQESNVTAASGGTETVNITSFLASNVNSNIDFLPVSLYYSDQEPYAPKAPVQDSNYTDTGLINARYNGTKTTEEDFSGISPAVAAKPFDAAIYNLAVTSNFICSQSLADRDIVPILFEGPTEFPEVSSEQVGFMLGIDTGNAYASTVTGFDSETQSNISLQGTGVKLKPGDIISVNGQKADSTNITEDMQVLTVQELSTVGSLLRTVNLFVQRDVFATGDKIKTLFNVGSTRIVTRSSGARLLTIEGSRLIAISDKQVWVKENRNIVKTNFRGFVTEIVTACTV